MRRVVVSGLGLVTPLGCRLDENWRGLLAGRRVVRDVSQFDTNAYSVHKAAEISDWSQIEADSAKLTRSPGRATGLAIVAAERALSDAGLSDSSGRRGRAGVVMGTTYGEILDIEALNQDSASRGQYDNGSKRESVRSSLEISRQVAGVFGLADVAPVTILSACASGNHAISTAYDLIRRNECDLVVAGGCDVLSETAFTGFARVGAMSPDVCRPFDLNRAGLILGEGAGVLVLEALDSASARGVDIYAEVGGYGIASDAYHMTRSHPDASGATRAMNLALQRAQAGTADIDYISAHGTGTKTNDLHETIAIKKVFGEAAYQIPISSIKGVIGHTLGAASAIEAIVCALAVERGEVPGTFNLNARDPDCDLDYMADGFRKREVRMAMNNAYAFGGINVSLVFKRVSN